MGWLDTLAGTFDFDPATPGIFGDTGLSNTGDILGGLYSTYRRYTQPAAITQPAMILPPYVNPETRRPALGVAPSAGGGIPVGCISQRDIDIAAAAGTTPELVDLVLKLARRNKRRRRMLTKSDIGDISTMRQILGGGEAFKLWLAKATR